MRTSRNYYEILGLPKDASGTQIKRRYKQLVRKYHPDVANNKDVAHRLFLQIQEAYEALNDPIHRRVYDESLALEAKKAAYSSSAAAENARQSKTSVSQLIKDAQWAFIQRRFSAVVDLCNQALKLNPNNAQVYVILGDVFRVQKKINAAVNAYSQALQLNPDDRDTEKKLMKLVGMKIPKVDVKTTPRSAEMKKMAVMNSVGWSFAILLIMLISVNPGEPVPWLAKYIPQVSIWSYNLIILMAVSSAVVGGLLAANGLVRHPDEEIIMETGSGWEIIPIGPILLIGSGFFFLGAAAFYIVFGLLQGSVSRSVLTVFACVAGIVILSSLMYVESATIQVLLFGGNVSFLAMLVGWYIGAMSKPLSEY